MDAIEDEMKLLEQGMKSPAFRRGVDRKMAKIDEKREELETVRIWFEHDEDFKKWLLK